MIPDSIAHVDSVQKTWAQLRIVSQSFVILQFETYYSRPSEFRRALKNRCAIG